MKPAATGSLLLAVYYSPKLPSARIMPVSMEATADVLRLPVGESPDYQY